MIFFKKKEKKISNFFPENFIDIHSHLLPGIDDGAGDLDKSIKLLEQMAAMGISKLITTPHVMAEIYQNSSATIKLKLQEVRKELERRNINDISIDAAAEYMLDEQFLALLKNNDILPLKDKYILVEMSYINPPIHLFEILYEITLKGYIPVLAHPERYHFYHTNFEGYATLKHAGCLFQLNLLSLTNYYGKHIQKISKKILDLKMYDFVGTDLHHTNHLRHIQSMLTDTHKKELYFLLENNAVVFN